jgi:NaMN:DMB phosphoribosyltransferase
MPQNPHHLKNSVISEAMERSMVFFGDLRDEPFKAISLFGDPMMPSVAGIVSGVIKSGSRIMLAGGTQMAAVAAILNSLHHPLDNISIGTTCYVAEDCFSNLVELVRSVSNDIPIYSCNLHLAESVKPGLQAFAKGYVKEGVGAGGISIASMIKSNGRINGTVLLKAIELEYETVIEKVLLK